MDSQQNRAVVYLDHSRFSKISSALDTSVDMGHAERDRASYQQIYELLLKLVHAGRIVVPVSYWHVCETVRWPEDDRKARARYCSLVEELSQGVALRFWTDAYSKLMLGDLSEPTGTILDCFPVHHRASLAHANVTDFLQFTSAVALCKTGGLPIIEKFMNDQVNKFADYVGTIQAGQYTVVLPGKTSGDRLTFDERVCNMALQFAGTIAKTAQPGYEPARELRGESQDQVVLSGAKQSLDIFFQSIGLAEIARMPSRTLLRSLGAMAGFPAVVCGVAESMVTAKNLRRSPQNTFDLLHMSYLGLCSHFFMEAKFTKYGAKAASYMSTYLEDQPEKFLDKLKIDMKM